MRNQRDRMHNGAAPRATGGDGDGWHLARDARERMVADLEFSLEHAIQAFYRWKSECLAAVADGRLSGDDTAILNIIRMKDEPKRLSEVARLLNRTDTANIQYAIRKLVKLGLIESEGGRSRKLTRYRVTVRGREVTDAYADMRASLLMPMIGSMDMGAADFERVSHFLDLMASLYSQCTQKAAARGY
ncbi:MAG: winged helix DNA-binding protein [Azospirillaceae bacterium]